MYLRKWICFGIFYGFTNFAYSTDAVMFTRGEVVLSGELIEAACVVDERDWEQWIEFGLLTAREIRSQKDNAITRSFHIRLQGCALESQIYPGVSYRRARINFNSDSSSSDNQLIGITGDAKGFGIRLSDAAGKTVKLGEPTSDFILKSGINTLNFKATIVPLNNNIKAGEFYATVSFFMDYL